MQFSRQMCLLIYIEFIHINNQIKVIKMEDLELLKKEAETNIKNLAKQEAENVSKTTLDEINVKFVSKEEAEKSTADFKKEMAELQARIKKMHSTSET